MYFTTKNSMYIVDEKHQTIVGGFFKEETYYQKLSPIFIGEVAEIKLMDGRIVRTSPILSVKKSIDKKNFIEIKDDLSHCFNEDECFYKNFGYTIDLAFQDKNNSFYEIVKYVMQTVNQCKTEKEYQIADNMMIALTGCSIETLLEKYKQLLQEKEIEKE